MNKSSVINFCEFKSAVMPGIQKMQDFKKEISLL